MPILLLRWPDRHTDNRKLFASKHCIWAENRMAYSVSAHASYYKAHQQTDGLDRRTMCSADRMAVITTDVDDRLNSLTCTASHHVTY